MISIRMSVVIGISLLFTGCSSVPSYKSSQKIARASKSSSKHGPAGAWEAVPQGSGYYLDDGPGSHRPANLDSLPDAVPVVEPLVSATTRPYEVMNQSFVPQTSLDEPYKEQGIASWYGRKFHGAKTADGEIYDMFQLTAAHPTLPLPCYARVTNVSNGRSVIVRVNDRGPFLRSRVMDLSYAAAYKLGYADNGSAEVIVEKLTPQLIAQYQAGRPAQPQQSTLLASAPAQSAPVKLAATAMPISQISTVASPVSIAIKTNDDFAKPVQAINKMVFLQLGAFGEPKNAESLKQQVITANADLGRSTQVLLKEGLHRVIIGPFASVDQANDAAIELSASVSGKPVIRDDLILP
jgi:rare lipoprotein A